MALSRLEIEMSMNLARLQTDVGQATRILNNFQSSVKSIVGLAVGYFSARAIVDFTTGVIGATAALDDMAERTGLAVEELSRMQAIANVGGHSMETIEAGLVKLAKALGSVEEKSLPAKQALMAIGLDPDQLKSKELGEAYKIIADRLNTFKDGLAKTAILMEIFGKAGAAQAPFLKDLATQTEELRVVSAKQAAEAETLEKNWKRLMLTMGEAKKFFIIDMIPALNEIVVVLKMVYKESGLLAALWAGFGGVMSNMLKQSDTAQLEAVDKTIASLTSRLDELNSRPGPYARFNDAQKVAAADALNAALGKRAEIMARIRGADTTEPDAPRPDAPALVDFEKNRKEYLAGLNALQSLEAAFVGHQISAMKTAAQHQQGVLDAQHEMGIVSDKAYYSERLRLQESATVAELNELEKIIRVQNKASEDPNLKRGTAEYINAQKPLMESLEKRKALIAEIGRFTEMNELKSARAAEQYGVQLDAIRARLMSLKGDEVGAARLRRQLEQRDERKTFKDDPAAMRLIDESEDLSEIQVQLNENKKKYEEINERLLLGEERIQRQMRTGEISEIEGLRRTGDLRTKAVADMDAFVQKFKELAATGGTERMRLDAERLSESWEKLKADADVLGSKIKTVFEDAFSNSFAEFITGTKSMKEAFKDFAMSIISNLAKMQAQSIAKDLFKGISGSDSGGGLFGSIGSWFTGLFKADGGPVAGGGSYIVGERGPELFTPGVSGNITPNGAGGGAIIVQNISIDSRSDQATIRAAMRQASQQALDALNSSLRNGGSFARRVGTA